jgi:hypothetical protein
MRSFAFPIYDTSYATGGVLVLEWWPKPPHRYGPIRYDARQVRVLPPNPTVRIHLGSDSEPAMPAFTHVDGSPVAIRRIEPINDGDTQWQSMVNVELDVQTGIVIATTSERAVTIFVVAPAAAPELIRSSDAASSAGLMWSCGAALLLMWALFRRHPSSGQPV